MLTVAVWVPVTVGANSTMKLDVPPAGMGELGWLAMEKLPPLERDTFGVPSSVSGLVPVLLMVKVCEIVSLKTTASPKSVSSVLSGVVSPLEIVTPKPCTLISGAIPVPPRTKLKGFSSVSSLPIESLLVRVPVVLGVNLTWKELLLSGGMRVAGEVARAKSVLLLRVSGKLSVSE